MLIDSLGEIGQHNNKLVIGSRNKFPEDNVKHLFLSLNIFFLIQLDNLKYHEHKIYCPKISLIQR